MNHAAAGNDGQRFSVILLPAGAAKLIFSTSLAAGLKGAFIVKLSIKRLVRDFSIVRKGNETMKSTQQSPAIKYALLPAVAVAAVLISAAFSAKTPGAPPVAPVRPVTDEYFGVKVADPYRYMENLKDPEVAAWFKGQNDYTRAVLGRIPGRAALLARIKMLDESAPARVTDLRRLPGDRYFYQKRLATEDLAKLYVRDGEKCPPSM